MNEKVKNVYDRIEEVIRSARRSLIPDEFSDVILKDGENTMSGKEYVGISFGSLGRRMREMAEEGRLTRQKRAGKNYVEFGLAPVPAALPEPVA